MATCMEQPVSMEIHDDGSQFYPRPPRYEDHSFCRRPAGEVPPTDLGGLPPTYSAAIYARDMCQHSQNNGTPGDASRETASAPPYSRSGSCNDGHDSEYAGMNQQQRIAHGSAIDIQGGERNSITDLNEVQRYRYGSIEPDPRELILGATASNDRNTNHYFVAIFLSCVCLLSTGILLIIFPPFLRSYFGVAEVIFCFFAMMAVLFANYGTHGRSCGVTLLTSSEVLAVLLLIVTSFGLTVDAVFLSTCKGSTAESYVCYSDLNPPSSFAYSVVRVSVQSTGCLFEILIAVLLPLQVRLLRNQVVSGDSS